MIVELGEPIHYREWGDTNVTSPPVVLVHGLGGSHANWLAVAPLLGKTHRVYALDLPGFGLTPRWKKGSSLDVMGDALRRFVDHVSPGQPVHWVGNSMGGCMSLLEASSRPGRVRSVMGVCPAVPAARDGRRPDQRFLAMLVIGMIPFGHLYLRRQFGKASARSQVRELLRLCCVDVNRVPEAVIQAHIELASTRGERPWAERAFGEATRSLFSILVRKDRFIERVRAIRSPACIVHGEKDRLVDVRSSRELAAEVPHVELFELPNLGHIPQLEDPEGFVTLATSWWAKVSSDTPIATSSDEAARAERV